MKFKSNIELQAGLEDNNASIGAANQVLTANGGTGAVQWSDISSISAAVNDIESNITYYEVKNSSGATIEAFKGVMAVGTDGNSGHILIDEMVADGSVEARYFLGVTRESIPNGGISRVIAFGEVSQINTLAFTNGDVLWCDPAAPGNFTITEPLGPNLKIPAAIVLNSATNGKIQVRVQGNEGIKDLYDTKIASQVDGDVLVWDNTTGVWFNDSTLNVDYTNSRVGIGTTSPGRPLHVIGQMAIANAVDANSTGALLISCDGTSNKIYSRTVQNATGAHPIDFIQTSSTVMRIDSAGNVGVGTTSPTHKLQVVGGGAFNSYLNVQDPDVSGNGTLSLSHDSTGSSLYSNPASLNGSTVVLRLGINNLEKMRIANNGNVGIGTTSPSQKLHVIGSTRVDNGGLFLGGTSSISGNDPQIRRTNSSNDVSISTGGSDRVTILGTGNVGIGTTSPTEKLHVVGNGLFTGTLEVDTVNNGVGDFLTRTAGGVITRRTAAEVRSDIGAGTGNGTVTSIATNNGITGGTITTTGTIGLTGQALALNNLATNGLIARTGTNTVAGRTLTGTASQITVTNGDGVSGNPTISLPATITGLTSVTSTTFVGALTGNSSTATTLQTARTINGTSFNGSANITTANWGTARTINGTSINGSTNYTTANWGTARTITIGNTGKSVNGSANVSWTVGEIDDTIVRRTGTLTSQDWNTFIDGTEASWLAVSNASGSNRPTSAYNYGTVLNLSTVSEAKFQLYAPETASSGNGLWYRTGWNTIYRAWSRIWDDVNLVNPVTGIGTTNYLPKFTGSTTLGNSLIFDNGTNVGIGTTSPNYKLEVNNTSAGNLTTALTLNNGSSTTNTAVALRLQTDPTSTVNSYSEIRSTRTNSPTGGGVTMRFLHTNSTVAAASEMMRLDYLGLGIGTAGTTTITESRLGRFADGTAATPAYSFSNDINNGMYRITTDTLGFSTAGSEKLRISSAGNVSIGNTNNTFKLDVSGTGRFTDNVSITTESRYFQTAGAFAWGNSTTLGVRIGTDNVTGLIDFRRWLGGGTLHQVAAVRQVLGGSSRYGLGFLANDISTNSVATTVRMYIDPNNGYVGVGTDSPDYPLHVVNNIASNDVSLFISNQRAYGLGDVSGGALYLGKEEAGGNQVMGAVIGRPESQDNSTIGTLIFQTRTSGTPTEKMRITSSGNVGIGTTSPVYQLQLSTNSAAKPTSNVWTVVSDSRVKENIRTYNSGLEKVLQIEPKLFDYNGKAGFEKTKDNVGIIAQEIKKILPETVNTYKAKLNESDEEETELYSYDGHALTFALVNSIKELNKKIEQLETRIQTLENKQL